MKKKAPVLWVVVDRTARVWPMKIVSRKKYATKELVRLDTVYPELAPFRVVKYVPAPKPKKRKTK